MIRRPPRSTLFPTRRSSDLPGASQSSDADRSAFEVRGSTFFAPVRRSRYGAVKPSASTARPRSEEHTSELQSLRHLVCRLLLEKKKKKTKNTSINKNNHY